MTKQEFKDFCHEEFIKRGFVKKKKMYYLSGKDLLCGLYLQKSMGEAFYVEYDFFIGEYKEEKLYPTVYESDIDIRICVLSKQTIKGERFMGALIEYEKYDSEEIRPYFDEAFEKYIMPPILEGKRILLEKREHYFAELFSEERDAVLEKLLK